MIELVETVQRAVQAQLERLGIDVVTTPRRRAAYARDFGGLIHRMPDLVVRPLTREHLSASVRVLGDNSLPIVVRSAAHAQAGQSLAHGPVLDVSRLKRVSVSGDQIVCEPGAPWGEVVEAVRRHGLAPPVLTDNLYATVGGTLQSGGVGTSSFRCGLQVESCTAIERLDAHGRSLVCSAGSNAEAFEHMLGGMGGFGVAARVWHRLEPLPGPVQELSADYGGVEGLLADLDHLAAGNSTRLLGGYLHHGAGGWRARLRAAGEADLSSLIRHSRSVTPARPADLLDLFVREQRVFERWREAALGGTLYPWVEAFVPRSRAGDALQQVLRETDPAISGTGPILAWPVKLTRTLPMFPLAPMQPYLLLSVLPRVEPRHRDRALATADQVDAIFAAHGGKRHLSSWLAFDRQRWIQHFGDRHWQNLCAVKARLDPHGRFGNDFIRFQRPVGSG